MGSFARCSVGGDVPSEESPPSVSSPVQTSPASEKTSKTTPETGLAAVEYEKHLEEQAKGYRDRLVNDDGFRWEAAGVLALPDAGHEVVKGLRDRLATDDHFRWQVAEGMIPIDWARLPSYGDDEGDEQQHGPAPVTAPEPAPVAVDEHQKETGVQLPYRVNPPVVEPEPEPEAVVEEPEPEPEVPPVYPEIADTARVLATQVWTSGSMLRSRFYSGKIPHLCDQYLSHAQAMGWLAVDADDRIVKGQVDPRPVAVTRIPNF
jgi:hypothetical protein